MLNVNKKRSQNDVIEVVLVSLMLTLNKFNNFFGGGCVSGWGGHCDTYVCVSGGKKSSLFGKFGMLCFLETPILSDCIWTRTHNHLVREQTLNHLAKLAK